MPAPLEFHPDTPEPLKALWLKLLRPSGSHVKRKPLTKAELRERKIKGQQYYAEYKNPKAGRPFKNE